MCVCVCAIIQTKTLYFLVLTSFLRILNYFPFIYIYIGNSLCMPKQTFTKVLDLKAIKNYKQTYIQVKWCLYPDIPYVIEPKYVQIEPNSPPWKPKKIFKIVEHKNCSCNRPGQSYPGYEALRKAYISDISNDASLNGNSVNLHNLIHIF